MDLKGMIYMSYLVNIDKMIFFNYLMTLKLVPTIEMAMPDINLDTEFENYIIRTTTDPKF